MGNGSILGPKAVFLVERFNIQCPFLGGSSIRGSTELNHSTQKNDFVLPILSELNGWFPKFQRLHNLKRDRG